MSRTGDFFFGPEFDELDLPDMGEVAEMIGTDGDREPQDNPPPVLPTDDEEQAEEEE